MKLSKLFLAAAVLLTPAAALAAPGIVTTNVGLRAGPGEGFPTVDRIPGGAKVDIHGCLRGNAWCDVSWSDDRGWVSSQYLEYLYRDRYVYLPDYVDEIDVPVVSFALGSYWSNYYAGRPWYHRRAYWNGYWQSHERFATRLRLDRSAARIGRAAAARDATVTERTRTGASDRMTRENDHATDRVREGRDATDRVREGRDRGAMQSRVIRENAGAAERRQSMHQQSLRQQSIRQPMAGVRTQTPPVMARGHDEPRMGARIGHAGPQMQPNMGRVGGGSPMNARAQMAPSAPRAAAPAMAPGGGGGAPRGGGAVGGGIGGGGGHGGGKPH